MEKRSENPLVAVISKADAIGGGASRIAQDLCYLLNKDENFRCHHWLGYAGGHWQPHYRALHGGRKLQFIQRGAARVSSQLGFPNFFTPEIFTHYLNKRDEYSLYHFHDISRTFSPIALRWLVKRKPVVWTFHDCSAFTGGCLYPMGCEAHLNRCGECPQLDSWPLMTRIDRTGWMQDYKRATAESGLFVPIAPSNWMADEAFKTGMFKERPKVIPNYVDSNIFRMLPRKAMREKLNLPADRFISLLNVVDLADKRKGVWDAIEAIRNLQYRPLVIAMGKVEESTKKFFQGIETRFVGYISDQGIISQYCAAADVLLFPTHADNLPNAVLEAMACGTPTVGYSTGGMPDMVEHGVNGWLAATGDVSGLAKGLEFARLNPEQLAIWSPQCREKAVRAFSEKTFVDEHKNLYEHLLDGNTR